MADPNQCDVVVVGAGPGGEAVAARLVGHGLDTILVERELVGGECAYWACMPSKALLRPGDLRDEVVRTPGVRGDEELDPAGVLARRDEVLHDFDDTGLSRRLEKRGVRIVRGHGRLEGERRVRVGGDLLEARRAVVLAPGTLASLPPIEGLEDSEPWDNRQGTVAEEVPDSLVVLGGGVVGSELALAWSSVGARVELVEMADRLLAGEEDWAAHLVAEGLRDAGVQVHAGVDVQAARRDPERGDRVLSLAGGREVRGTELLVAAGRRPRTEDLGLETAGLEPGAGIEVDSRMRAGEGGWLYAVGDVNGRALLTHEAKRQARIAADVIAGGDAEDPCNGMRPPRVVYTDPQIAAVGHTLQSAREAGLHVRPVDFEWKRIPGSSFAGRGTVGGARLVLEGEGAEELIVGATFCGWDVAELLHSATVAVAGRVPLAILAHAAPAFPTRSEIWLRLLEEAGL